MAALRGVFTFAWIILAWGAFRNVLGVSRSSTIFSLAIFFCLGSIAVLVAVFFQMAPIMWTRAAGLKNGLTNGIKGRVFLAQPALQPLQRGSLRFREFLHARRFLP